MWEYSGISAPMDPAAGGADRAGLRRSDPFKHVCTGLLYYYLTSFVVALGALFSLGFVKEARTRGHLFGDGSAPFYTNWDGQWYLGIVRQGYFYKAGDFSSVNFFPAYPVLARALASATGLAPEVALLVVSQVCLQVTFALLSCYAARRPEGAGYVLLSLGLAPPSFFFRMAYAESLFLLLTVLLLLGMQRRWPLPALAAIVGLATATRPVGVALLPALAYHVWVRDPRPRACAMRLAVLLPVALWGLAAYMAYLAFAFGEPTAFIDSHQSWNRHPSASGFEKVRDLFTLRPFWARIDPSSSAYWAVHDGHDTPLFSLYLADPLYFLLAAVLVAVGARRRWLSTGEALVAAGLLAMPCVFKCYETGMEAFARYACTNPPVFLALGAALRRVPPEIGAGLLALCGTLMALYTALFARWYVMF
jgi:hypothetical protein